MQITAPPLFPRGRPRNGSTNDYTVPGVSWVGETSRTLTSGRMYYEQMLVETPQTISDFVLLNVITADAGTPGLLRVGIYSADLNWQPEALIVDAGAFDTSATGQKTLTLGTPQALAPGRYLLANLSNNSTVVLRAYTGNVPGGNGIVPALTANAIRTSMFVAQAYGALPSSPPAWTGNGNGNTPFVHTVFCNVSAP